MLCERSTYISSVSMRNKTNLISGFSFLDKIRIPNKIHDADRFDFSFQNKQLEKI